MKKLLSKILLPVFLITALSHCAKEREPSFPDGQGDDIFEKSLFTNASLQLKTSDQQSVLKDARFHSFADVVKLKAELVAGPETSKQLFPLFNDLRIIGKKDSQYQIRFALDEKYVTALKVATDSSEMPIQEQEISSKTSSEYLVPIFQYEIKNYGILSRVKNDLGEETSTLRLEETNWEKATHIQISNLSKDRISIDVPAAEKEEAEQVFIKDRIHQSVLSRKELADALNIQVAMNDSTLFYTMVDGTLLKLYEITDLSS